MSRMAKPPQQPDNCKSSRLGFRTHVADLAAGAESELSVRSKAYVGELLDEGRNVRFEVKKKVWD